MSYALVQDIPASWEHYRGIARMFRRVPSGLLLHVAGPTDEGFRIIEVWESEVAWRQFASDFVAALGSIDPDVRPRAIVRDLRAVHVVVGEAMRGAAQHDRISAGPGVVVVPDVTGKERGR